MRRVGGQRRKLRVCKFCEKCVMNGNNVFYAFMDLENNYNKIGRHAT